jgi:predicted dehydrogenase
MSPCLVIGQGSIGQRHARVLRELGASVATVSRRGGGDFAALAPALKAGKPEIVVVATETSAHADTLADLAGLDYDGVVLVEKPLFAASAPLPANRFLDLRVTYQLRFHPALRAFKERLAGERILSAQIYVGQYLPDWRPGRDYRDTYSAKASLGGGALRDLSHELDYAAWLFGSWRGVTALGGAWSDLAIDADDVYLLLMRYATCPAASIQLNYLHRPARREVVVNTARHTFTLDLKGLTLRCDTAEPERFTVGSDDCYRAMHETVLAGRREDLCDASEALDILALIAAAERSAAGQGWIERQPMAPAVGS